MAFSEFWLKFPRKVAKKAAEKAYAKTVKQVPHEAIMASLELMLAGEWRGRKPEYIPHAASYLNRESFDLERVEALEDEQPMPPKPHEHWCKWCAVGHAWTCEDADCIYPTFAECEQVSVNRRANVKKFSMISR